LKTTCGNKFTKERWQACECLVIDEVSMLSAELFEKLDVIARKIRKSELVFGGIQLVAVGDFFQLPAVKATRLCFQSDLWSKCFQRQHCIELTKIYRQQDLVFTTMLDEIRDGTISTKTTMLLKELKRPLCKHNGVEATVLKTLNKDVNMMNKNCLLKLRKPIQTYVAIDSGEEPFLSRLKKTCNAEARLELCEGAQVMLVRNISTTAKLCNGSRGVVTGFHSGLPQVQFIALENPISVDIVKWSLTERRRVDEQLTYVDVAYRMQIPLKLAFAATIHKAQGLTLEKTSISLSNVFESGQAYVALSRARDLRSLQVCDFNMNSFKTNPACIAFAKQLTNIAEDAVLPACAPRGVWVNSAIFHCLCEEPSYDEVIIADKKKTRKRKIK